jgi:hypothetical protein
VAAFEVSSIAVVDYRTIDITFSNPLGTSDANLAVIGSVGTYSITPHIDVQAAIKMGASVLRVITLPQSEGALYRLEITGALVDNTDQALGSNYGIWTAVAATPKVLVTNADARSECFGRSIRLSWTLPVGATRTKIVRRLNAWPFDLADDIHDVVYEGAPISSFLDTGILSTQTTATVAAAVGATSISVVSSAGFTAGNRVRIEALTGYKKYDIVTVSGTGAGTISFASTPLANAYAIGDRVSISSELQPQTYYYYLLLVSDDAGPYVYDLDDSQRVFALSIDVFDGQQWFIDNTTKYALEMDAKSAAEGGGGGFLTKWFAVMGCWLNLMRGHINAIALVADPDKAPFHTLTAKSRDMGIDPEGYAYDFDIVRRPLGMLKSVYSKRGTCRGIIETVSMFTRWESVCQEFGFNQCQGGAGDVKTWDGVSQFKQSTLTGLVQHVVATGGAAQVTDAAAAAWTVDLFKDGTIWGGIGDIACVETNDTTTRALTKSPRLIATLTAQSNAGANTITLDKVKLLRPHMAIQIISGTIGGGYYASEIREIASIAGLVVTLKSSAGLSNTYPTGSIVTIGKSIIRAEYDRVSTSVGGQVLNDTVSKWVNNQWKGYKLLDSANVKHTIESNTQTSVTVDGAPPAAGTYAIALDFTLGGNWAARTPWFEYIIGNGIRTTWFEPTYDLELRGLIYDPYDRLYNGPGLNLFGVWGPNDVAAYITTQVTVADGQAQGVSGFTFTLDPDQPAPGVNAWVGYWLNPNQNQEQMFEILANDATTITVAGGISSLVVAGQYYYVLKPRDKVRFQRVVGRLRKEFTDTDVRIHVLFD